MTALGATFIKLGQFLSMRSDILPPELIEELSLLQDKVPPFPYYQVKARIEEELGQAMEIFFQSFVEEPIASASIGQVHKACLHDGTPVAVKVQRLGLANLVYQDIGIMRLIFRLGRRCCIPGDWGNYLDLVDQFGRGFFLEMDYLEEGRHADHLRNLLRQFPPPRYSAHYLAT